MSDPTQPDPSPPPSIAIVGAGIGGLTAALALRKHGFNPRVYERSPELAEVGAGITLWPNATRVMEYVGVYERLRTLGVETTTGAIGTSDGRVLSALNIDDALGMETARTKHTEPEPAAASDAETTGRASVRSTSMIALHRADLQRALYDALPAASVELGAACTGVTSERDRVVVHLDRAGEREDIVCDLLVGADGIHSAVRRAMRPGDDTADHDTVRYAGYTCWRGLTPVFEGWSGELGEFWGRGRRFGAVQIRDDLIYWFATANAPRDHGFGEDSPARRKRRVAELFADWAFQVPALIERTPPDAILHNDIEDLPPSRGWSDGRVVLLGDAIHATTPNLGQGAAMAIESAVVLARCLEKYDAHDAAFAAYESIRAPRTAMITNTSWRLGRAGQWANPVACWFRNLGVRWMPDWMQRRQLREVALYDAVTGPLCEGS